MLNLVAFKETTRGEDINNALERNLRNADVPLNNIFSVATDGAPTMVWKNVGLIMRL